MDEHHYKPMDVWDNGVYGTGPTEPPPNNNAIVALLLIVVIFLSGLVSVLSFMNVRLFQQLQQEQLEHIPSPIAFAEDDSLSLHSDYSDLGAAPDEEAYCIPALDVTVYLVTEFDQNYFHWPQGLIVIEAGENAPGLQVGDVLIRAGGEPITDPISLNRLLNARRPIDFTVSRAGEEITLNFAPER